jgi:hypothetical protein
LIGGVIVLSLLITALGAVVFVSQQYDQYQQTVNKIAQYRNQQLSEDIVAISPGLTVVNSTTGSISGWGGGCGITTANPEYNCYNIIISNVGSVGVQITRIYINSTGPAGSGCSYSASSPNPQPCILNPTSTIAAYAFNQANQFINPGEAKYQVTFALPTGVALPDPNPAFPQNTILIATGRGNVFSFQWPFQVSVFGQSQSAFSSGNMKVAYQPTSTSGGYNSANEPSFTGKTTGSIYCHTESPEPYSAPAGYAEELTGITGLNTGTALYFVNPWITGGPISGSSPNTESIMYSANNNGATTIYIYVVVINTGTMSYTPTAGTLDLMWYGSNHIDGYLFGVYYNGAFYSTSPYIPPGAYYYAIFKITIFTISITTAPTSSVMFWGGASITDKSETQSYFSGTILVSGLWIRYEASLGGCA